jgi:hypothetical protein
MAIKKVGWQLDLMPEKMVALATFHESMLRNMQSTPQTYNKIVDSAARIISKYFDAYVDHIAKIDPYRFHHIYEFDKVGMKNSRLFKSQIINGQITYTLIEASNPNREGYPFPQKAFVMEEGRRLVIKPNKGSLLFYEVDGDFTASSQSTIENPGGPFVAGAFQKIFEEFFNSNLPEKALREFGFYDTIVKGLEQETKIIEKAISAGDIKNSAAKAARAAYGIADRLDRDANRL